MEKDYFFQVLLQNIPRKGMPKNSQKIFPHVARAYIDGTPLNGSYGLKAELSKKSQRYAEDIYGRLDNNLEKALNNMKISILREATQIMTTAGHPIDLKQDYMFVDTMFNYYIKFVDEKEGLVRKLAKSAGVKINFLKKEKTLKDRKELERIARRPNFYDFLFEHQQKSSIKKKLIEQQNKRKN